MTGEQLIIEVERITQANLDFVQRKVKHLNAEQLHWKSDVYTWSIIEVLAHLNSFSTFYNPVFQTKIAKTRFRKPTVNFQSSPLGRASWRAMQLGNVRNVKRKFRATFDYNPTLNPVLIIGDDQEIFIKEQLLFLDILENARQINVRKARVPVSISKIIKFRIGDAFLFVAYHNERHVEQIKSILKHPKFPKN